MISRNRNACWMYLSETGITKKCTFLMRLPYSRHITSHGIGGEIKNISITAGAQQYCMSKIALQFTGYQITHDNSPCLAIDIHHIQHFMPRIHFYITEGPLSFQCLVSTD